MNPNELFNSLNPYTGTGHPMMGTGNIPISENPLTQFLYAQAQQMAGLGQGGTFSFNPRFGAGNLYQNQMGFITSQQVGAAMRASGSTDNIANQLTGYLSQAQRAFSAMGLNVPVNPEDAAREITNLMTTNPHAMMGLRMAFDQAGLPLNSVLHNFDISQQSVMYLNSLSGIRASDESIFQFQRAMISNAGFGPGTVDPRMSRGFDATQHLQLYQGLSARGLAQGITAADLMDGAAFAGRVADAVRDPLLTAQIGRSIYGTSDMNQILNRSQAISGGEMAALSEQEIQRRMLRTSLLANETGVDVNVLTSYAMDQGSIARGAGFSGAVAANQAIRLFEAGTQTTRAVGRGGALSAMFGDVNANSDLVTRRMHAAQQSDYSSQVLATLGALEYYGGEDFDVSTLSDRDRATYEALMNIRDGRGTIDDYNIASRGNNLTSLIAAAGGISERQAAVATRDRAFRSAGERMAGDNVIANTMEMQVLSVLQNAGINVRDLDISAVLSAVNLNDRAALVAAFGGDEGQAQLFRNLAGQNDRIIPVLASQVGVRNTAADAARRGGVADVMREIAEIAGDSPLSALVQQGDGSAILGIQGAGVFLSALRDNERLRDRFFTEGGRTEVTDRMLEDMINVLIPAERDAKTQELVRDASGNLVDISLTHEGLSGEFSTKSALIAGVLAGDKQALADLQKITEAGLKPGESGESDQKPASGTGSSSDLTGLIQEIINGVLKLLTGLKIFVDAEGQVQVVQDKAETGTG